MDPREIEEKIVSLLIIAAKEHGWTCESINNGDGWLPAPADFMEEVFACDDCELNFTKPGFQNQWVYLVFGNDGYDVICDNTQATGEHGYWNKVIGIVDKYAATFGG